MKRHFIFWKKRIINPQEIRYILVSFIVLTFFISGCVSIPINKDGEVQVSKDTSVSMDDLGVGRVKNKF